ncbi:hypothetical protein F4553_001839 [Allocatelliglobosispora scoriae]|uniref:Uncharacterized protein n=1 Tax=Allocatelliglobosispora scoriae TaxID=643052 RepID=A0A841BNS8_9ACTN|nr:hypothetical protein [Allocatelliglobosispora scoriae]MBB5868460.1 hypothetical protein [Allocatelliglobosispora scoriae]
MNPITTSATRCIPNSSPKCSPLWMKPGQPEVNPTIHSVIRSVIAIAPASTPASSSATRTAGIATITHRTGLRRNRNAARKK